MPVLPFSSDAEVVDFANAFLREHVERFRKDIKICLTRNKNKTHAYFPALIAYISFATFERPLCRQSPGHATQRAKNLRAKIHGGCLYVGSS